VSLRALLLALACLLVPAGAAAQGDTRAAELRIKAAFLYKFCDFVEWPARAFAAPERAFTIGILGADALADELAAVVSQRSVHGRPVVVRKLRHGASLTGLHLLFVGGHDGGRLPEVLAAAKGRPTLTVTEVEDGEDPGSVINFVLIADKVRFDVALPPAEAGGLKISARLLAVARRVVAGAS
jgi:uncharacterized protein DUF4154